MYHGTKKRIAKYSAESTFSSIRFGEASLSLLASVPKQTKRFSSRDLDSTDEGSRQHYPAIETTMEMTNEGKPMYVAT
jgi:hypothetical protein